MNQSDLCAHLLGASSLEAKKRRLERGCRDPQWTELVFLAFLLALLLPGKLLISMDRTTWERGDAPLNLLVLGLVADWEFIGGEWFRFLRRKVIKRAIRIRKNAAVDELHVDA